MRRIKFPAPTPRALALGAWLVAALVLVLLVWMLFIIARLSDDAVETKGDLSAVTKTNEQQDATLTAQDAALDEANRRLNDAGKAPVSVPPTPEPAVGEAGERGPVGPAGADGERGPRGFTGLTGPTGKAGEPGMPGPSGPVGPTGKAGTDGSDGETIVGPVGLRGEKGEAGERGPAGPAGERGPAGADSTIPGPEGPAGTPATCDGDFVCAGELDAAMAAALANYLTRDDILALLRALGCETDKPQLVTCAITGKP